MLKAVTGVFNINQDASLPPSIYSSIFNAVTGLLLSKLAELYPSDPSVLDMLDPFVEKKVIPVTDGYIQLPENYRNILGSPQIAAKNSTSQCNGLSVQLTSQEFNSNLKKSGCTKRPIIIVPQSEFALQTTSTYRQPDFWNPIGFNSGKKQITVCPANISSAEVLYVKNENIYRYGYIMQPDDTYIFDKITSEESQWNNSSFEPIFKGICACYAAYSRNTELRDWSLILSEKGIL
jgi:hypothetical protein